VFNKKVVDIIISIACAFALWAYVTAEVNPPDDKTIPGVHVDLVNLESLAADNLTVASGPFAVDVVVNGARSDVNKLTAEDFTATADMSNYPLGVSNVEVTVTGPDGIDILSVSPERIEVEVEELVSANKPIRLNYSEDFPPDMEPGFISVKPDQIEVSGTKSNVDDVSYVRAEIDSSQLRESETTITANVVPVNKGGDRVFGVSMSQNSVEVTLRLCYVKEVPLDIEIRGKPPGSLAVTKQDVPDKVFILGSEEALADIKRVKAAPIDISNLRSTTIITPELKLPKDVQLAEASSGLAVTIEIGGEEARSLTVTNDMIDIRGVPEGYSANIITGTISATIFGSREQLANFEVKDLGLFIDLATMDPTQGQVKVLIDHKKADTYKRVDFSPIAVDVRITVLSDTSLESKPRAENVSGPSIGSDDEKGTE
jgi:YbbR domain-containing protein